MTKPTVARLTSPAQIVSALPLYLGYVPTQSLVVVCQHEPRGRLGLTLRFDLPPAAAEEALVDQVVTRVRRQGASRVLLAVYTSEPDTAVLPRSLLVEDVLDRLGDLDVTDALLVRHGVWYSYVCPDPHCCPPGGTAITDGYGDDQVGLLAAELVLQGQATMPSREALEASLAGPTFLAAKEAVQRCEAALQALLDAREAGEREAYIDRMLAMWVSVAQRFSLPRPVLHPDDAAALAVSLGDKLLRDVVATRFEVPGMTALLAELCRRTPTPWDVPVCTLFAWASYCEGGGAQVTIALERALSAEPEYELAVLVHAALLGQCDPEVLRRITSDVAQDERVRRWAC